MPEEPPTPADEPESLELRVARLEDAVGRLTERVIELSSPLEPWRCGEPAPPEALMRNGTSEKYARYWITGDG
jgi:hypothetical protein